MATQQVHLTFNDPNQDQSQRHYRTERSVADYQETTLHAHIYNKSDSYIGSTDKVPTGQWLFDSTTSKFIYANVTLPEGVERCFIEILSNAGDNCDASRRMGVDPGKIYVTMDNRTIKIRSEGEPIPLYPKEDSRANEPMYVVDSIFGKLLTSSNYDIKVIRMGCGTNGYGSKVVSIYSKSFIVRCGDPKNGQYWEGVWANNMLEKVSSVVTPGHVMNPQATSYKDLWISKGQPYTGPAFVEVEYVLDFYRFGYQEYPIEAIPLFSRNTLDMGFSCKVPVAINGVEYDVRNIADFAKLYFSKEAIATAYIHYEWPGGVEPLALTRLNKAQKKALINNPPSPDLIPIVEMMALDTPDNGICLSYVNGIMTKEGGVHANECYDAFAAHILEKVNSSQGFSKKGKKGEKKESNPGDKAKLTLSDLKAHVSMIINTRLPDPKFVGQTKHRLSSPKPSITIEERELNIVDKWSLFDRLLASLEAKMFRTLKKGETGKKRGRVCLGKGEDATEAKNPANAHKCILYIVEGKSALGYPTKRIDLSPGGKDFNGCLPLRGKVLNVLKANFHKLASNVEINDIKKLIGIKEGVDYTIDANVTDLRYGLICINTDADSDGTHIRSLLIALFHSRYSSILKRGMICYLLSFAVKLLDKKGVPMFRFTSVEEYNEWEQKNSGHGYEVKYFKGLGTCSDEDVEDDMKHACIVICMYDQESADAINLAFKTTNLRQEWIAKWRDMPKTDDIIAVAANSLIKYRKLSHVINRDLVDYTIDSLFRAIPSYKDGIKKGQRQALSYILKEWDYGKSTKKSMKVDRIAARAAEATKYHHGPTSMIGTIITMAQDFVGTNNLNYFQQKGQMGKRSYGGEDRADARYSETCPEWWLRYVVQKEMVDLVQKRIVEGEEVEPEWIPMDIPMHLVNGMLGMGTGHSTFGPCYNVYDIIAYLVALCRGEKPVTLIPAYRGFRGTIEVVERNKNLRNKMEITKGLALPVGKPVDLTKIQLDMSKLSLAMPKSFVPPPPLPEPLPVAPEEKDDEEKLDELLPSERKVEGEDEGDEEEEDQESKAVMIAKMSADAPLSMVTKGTFSVLVQYTDGSVDVQVTELPIGRWTHDYQLWLEELEKEGKIDCFRDASTTKTVNFTINKFRDPEGPTHRTLKLQRSFGLTNMTLIDDKGYPKKYKNADEIIKDYYTNMIPMYEKLRLNQIEERKQKIVDLTFKRELIMRVSNKEIVVFKQSKPAIFEQMDRFNIPRQYFDKVKLHHFTDEDILKLGVSIEKLHAEIAHIQTLRPEGMWLERLGIFYNSLKDNKYEM